VTGKENKAKKLTKAGKKAEALAAMHLVVELKAELAQLAVAEETARAQHTEGYGKWRAEQDERDAAAAAERARLAAAAAEAARLEAQEAERQRLAALRGARLRAREEVRLRRLAADHAAAAAAAAFGGARAAAAAVRLAERAQLLAHTTREHQRRTGGIHEGLVHLGMLRKHFELLALEANAPRPPAPEAEAAPEGAGGKGQGGAAAPAAAGAASAAGAADPKEAKKAARAARLKQKKEKEQGGKKGKQGGGGGGGGGGDSEAELVALDRFGNEVAVPLRVPISVLRLRLDPDGILMGCGRSLGQKVSDVLVPLMEEEEHARERQAKSGKHPDRAHRARALAKEGHWAPGTVAWKDVRMAISVVMPATCFGDDAELLVKLGMMYAARGDWELARGMCRKAVAKVPRDMEVLVTYGLALAHTDAGGGEELAAAFAIAERCHRADAKNARVIDGRRLIHEMKYAWDNRGLAPEEEEEEEQADDGEFETIEAEMADGSVRRTTVRRSVLKAAADAAMKEKGGGAAAGHEFEDRRGWEWAEAQKAARSAAIALSAPDADVDALLAAMEAQKADGGLDEHGRSRVTVIRMPVLNAKRAMEREEADAASAALAAARHAGFEDPADAKVAQEALMQGTKSQLFNSAGMVDSAKMATLRVQMAETAASGTMAETAGSEASAAGAMTMTMERSGRGEEYREEPLVAAQ